MNFQELNEETQQAINKIVRPIMDDAFWDFYTKLRKTLRQHLPKVQTDAASFADDDNIILSEIDITKISHSRRDKIESIINNIDLGKIFLSIDVHKNILDKVASKAPLLYTDIIKLKKAYQSQWENFNSLIGKPDNFLFILSILNGYEYIRKIHMSFRQYAKLLTDASALLDSKRSTPKKQAGLKLGFTLNIETLAELNFRLNSLQVVYTEACLIFGVNENTYPLTLSKIESGSLWTRIFGESKVIEFVTWFFKSSIQFLHRNYTLEGKLERIPSDVRILDKQLGLYKKLKETLPEKRYKELLEGQAETLAKASVIIAKHTQNLLERETRLKIDGEMFELNSPHDKKYVEAVKKQLPGRFTFMVVDPDSVKPPPKALSIENKKQKKKPKNG